MKTPARIGKHPIHPMLVAVPLGLWIFSLACDVLYLMTRNRIWSDTAFITMMGGIVGAVLAAIPGLIDYLYVKDRNARAKKIGAFHMALNVLALILYSGNALLRIDGIDNPELILSVVNVLILTVSGWLGGELIYVEGVSVNQKPTDLLREEKDKAA